MKKKKKASKANGGDESDVVVLNEDIMEVLEGSSAVSNGGLSDTFNVQLTYIFSFYFIYSFTLGTASKKDKELIEKQKEEIQKLKRINAELYSFMAKELTDS